MAEEVRPKMELSPAGGAPAASTTAVLGVAESFRRPIATPIVEQIMAFEQSLSGNVKTKCLSYHEAVFPFATRMRFWPAMASWLQRNRTSVRLAFILRMVAMAV